MIIQYNTCLTILCKFYGTNNYNSVKLYSEGVPGFTFYHAFDYSLINILGELSHANTNFTIIRIIKRCYLLFLSIAPACSVPLMEVKTDTEKIIVKYKL